jgi:REP element-mobilizing transposase RayT
MPMRDSIKQYLENGIYHIYNRGVNKQNIFVTEHNFVTFMYLLKTYLNAKAENTDAPRKNYFGRVNLLAFCLMENHIHMLIEQKDTEAMREFMHSLGTSFTMRTNMQNGRVGCLFQGVYKARIIRDENDLINVSKYIHLNPERDPFSYPYSSIRNYTGYKGFSFVNTSLILGLFDNSRIAYTRYLKVKP